MSSKQLPSPQQTQPPASALASASAELETNLPERRPSWRLKVDSGSKVCGSTHDDARGGDDDDDNDDDGGVVVLESAAVVERRDSAGWCAWMLSFIGWEYKQEWAREREREGDKQ